MFRIAHRVDVCSAEALLTGCQARAARSGEPGEVALELHHARSGQKQGGVRLGHQRGAWDHLMALLLKKMEEYLPDLVTVQFYHLYWANLPLAPSFPILV